jgi:pyruvate ferredoxin oxidoreductase gamma subunit
VLAAELLAVAAFEDGKYGQAFPAFGGERRGAPVKAFVRLDSQPIRLRHRVNHPKLLLVLDPSLLELPDLLAGLPAGGLALVNSEKAVQQLAWSAPLRAAAIPATRIALQVFGKPFVNPAMLGAFAALTGFVTLEAVQRAFQHRFPGKIGELNARAARFAADWVAENHVQPQPVDAAPIAPAPAFDWPGASGLGVPGQPFHPAVLVAPRTSLAYPTGAWRYSRPVFDPGRCNACGLCDKFCPDGCILVLDEGKRSADLTFCKGCGICACECPRSAIHMLVEEV